MRNLFSKLSIRATLAGLLGVMGLSVAALSGHQMWDAYRQRDAAIQAETLSKLNKNLFDAMVNARYEQILVVNSLIQSPEANQPSVALIKVRRDATDKAMAEAQQVLAQSPIEALKPKAAALREGYATYMAMREPSEPTPGAPVAERDKSLPARSRSTMNLFSGAIEATTATVESEIRAANPSLSDLVLARATAWSARAAGGTIAQTLSMSLALNRPLDDKEVNAIFADESRAAYSWNQFRTLVNADTLAPEIRAAVAKAEAAHYAGSSYKDTKDKLIQTLASGGVSTISTDAWRGIVTPSLNTVGDVASAAIDELNKRASATAGYATFMLAQYAVIFVGTLLLAGFGFMIVRSRVAGPIDQMTQAMKTMAEGDLSVAVPHCDRTDEIGGMAQALTIFKENGLRVRALEAQEREASAARLARAESMASVVSDVGEVVSAAAAGDFSARLQIDQADEQMQKLVAGINEINAVVDSATSEFALALQAVAGGDLTCRIDTAYRGKFAELKGAINETVDRLSSTVRTIQTTSADVGLAAREINMGADDLSKRTEEQASSLEETAATTEELAASVKASAQASRQAAAIADEAMQAAQSGGAIAHRAVDAMARIESASQKISDIIRVIDDIAFQTNLLALNAAVEAARAGDAGKGFAVVASEVRTLAQRSGAAAKDISALISSSNLEVGEGVKLVRQAGEQLGAILEASQKVASTIADISAAAGEQANGIDEMSQAVAHLDEMTQANAALAEQSAASAGSLSGKIGQLNDLVAAFRTAPDQTLRSRPAPGVGELQSMAKLAQLAFAQKDAPTRAAAAPPAPQKAAAPRRANSSWEEF